MLISVTYLLCETVTVDVCLFIRRSCCNLSECNNILEWLSPQTYHKHKQKVAKYCILTVVYVCITMWWRFQRALIKAIYPGLCRITTCDHNRV